MTDPRVDAYIAEAAPFAQPILMHLRNLVHATIPDAEEAIKWGMPHFLYRGKMMAAMAAFKAHCAFMIHGDEQGWAENEGMGTVGKLTRIADLPPDETLTAQLRAVAARIETSGSALPKKTKTAPRAAMPVPEDFAVALRQSIAAQATWDGFPPSARREYLEWIMTAKQAATRERRIAQAVDWIAEGKKRNWKYEKC